MLNYLEYLNIEGKVAISIVAFFLISQVIGELLKLKGIVVPEFMNVRNCVKRKKQQKQQERENILKMQDTMAEMGKTLTELQESLIDLKSHYNKDNITMRDKWIENVNIKLDENDEWRKEFDKKLDKNNAITISLLIESKRNTIINFASKCCDKERPCTKEEYDRIFKLYKDYEDIIKENGLVNGEVEISMKIIEEEYENNLRNNSFLENIRGYH